MTREKTVATGVRSSIQSHQETFAMHEKKVHRRLRTTRAIAAALGVLLASGATFAGAETIVGLTNTQQLAMFDSASPTMSAALVSITGLQQNETLLGIDFRPSTGTLYGLSSGSRIFTLDPFTGAASLLAPLTTADGSMPYTLAGGAYGVDFNPVPDLGQTLASLRVTSTSGENLRINVNSGTAGRTNVDTPLSGPQGTPRIAGSAYTNPDRDPVTGTALFGIDFVTDSVYQQASPNNGVLTLIGALGVDTNGLVGFDHSIGGTTYASLTSPLSGKSSLYTVSEFGAASLVGEFGIMGNTAIAPSLTDITVAIPEPGEYAMMLAGLATIAGIIRRRRKSAA